MFAAILKRPRVDSAGVMIIQVAGEPRFPVREVV
jgi:hypothetical protein